MLSEAEASAMLLALPKRWDWREHGVVTPVKSQGGCGSCWSFSAAEAIESAHAIATGELVVLSEQNILDCTPNPLACGGHGGCTGATPVRTPYDSRKRQLYAPGATTTSLIIRRQLTHQRPGPTPPTGACVRRNAGHWRDHRRGELSVPVRKRHGQPSLPILLRRHSGAQSHSRSLSFVGPRAMRTPIDTTHTYQPSPLLHLQIVAEVSGYVKLPPNDYARVMHALATVGPLSVNLDASKFFLYRGGIFDACENSSTSDIDHAVRSTGAGVTDVLANRR